MTPRSFADGSAGDVDYSRSADAFRRYRTPDPRIQATIERALGDAETVVNVGAGTGGYEPEGRDVTAVEPSASMRAQRTAAKPAVDATADDLPFETGEFAAAMITMSVHQWPDLEAGLHEVRRVTRGPVVILTEDPARLRDFWLVDYCPTVLDTEVRRFPSIERIAAGLGGDVEVEVVEYPLDCTDGLNQAYYGRPEMLLDDGARRANSAWEFVDDAVQREFVQRLGAELASGEWDRKYGELRETPSWDGGLRLVVGRH